MSASDSTNASALRFSADDASIHLVAGHVIDAVQSGVLPPAVLRLRRSDDAIDVEATPLEDAHPSELLVGHRLDERYFAVGVAARGWAYHCEADPAERSRVSVVSIISRSGEHANVTRADDADHPVNSIDEAPTAGEQVDLMLRCLGLDTAPPPCPATDYWTLEWMASIADEILDTGDVCELEWDDVRALHPAAILLRLGGYDPDEHDFAEMASSFGRITDWSRIRTMIDNGGYGAVGLEPGDGEWFDDGSIARYLMSRLPPVENLRTTVESGVSRDALHQLGVHLTTAKRSARHCDRRAS